jgi:hypothetical protein
MHNMRTKEEIEVFIGCSEDVAPLIEGMGAAHGGYDSLRGGCDAQISLATLQQLRQFPLDFSVSAPPIQISADGEINGFLKSALRDDGFDVAAAPDGQWYWADEQDRRVVDQGEFATEEAAWRDLALAREHILEDLGLILKHSEPAAAAPEPLRSRDADFSLGM